VTDVTECGEAKHEGLREEIRTKILKTRELGGSEGDNVTMDFGPTMRAGVTEITSGREA
jgi:hypothetical protein